MTELLNKATLSEVLDDFGHYLRRERRLSENTVLSYLSDLKMWSQRGLRFEAEGAPPEEEFKAALRIFEKEGHSEKSLARRNSALRLFSIYRAFENPEWEVFSENLPKAGRFEHFPKALSIADVKKILDFEVTGEPRLLRNRAMLELAYAAGLRVSELIHLELSALDERAGALKVIGKGGHERWVPYSERAAHWLSKYLNEARPLWASGLQKKAQDLIFLSPRKKALSRMAVWKILNERALLCGVENAHPHALRHSLATHLLQGGADLRFVQALLGHRSLNTTEKYLKIADDELKSLFEKIHPLRAVDG